jgi:acyl dehydratase
VSEPDYDFPVDRSAILNFAAAIGETNPIYWDAASAAGTPLGDVIAPPTFGVASAQWNPNYGLRGMRKIPPRVEPPASEAKPRSGGGGGGGLARVLHGEQRFEYHKPLQPGMRLRVATRPGKVWEKEGKRGGKLRFTETVSEYRDERNELVLVSTSIGVLTEKAVEK